MDKRRFDALARLLAAGTGRREVAKALTGLAMAGAVTRTTVRNAAACLEDGQFCSHDDECCGVCISFNCTDCVPKGSHGCENDKDCCGGKQECVNGVCKKRKKGGKVKCDGRKCNKRNK
jgi:hypothetical protein